MKYYQLNIYTERHSDMVQPVIDEVLTYLSENGLAGCWDKSEVDRLIVNAWNELEKDWIYFDDYKDDIVIKVVGIEIEE